MTDALDLLHGLVTEDKSTTWGEQAARFQLDDAAAICADPSAGGPRRHFLVRPRGASKTTDAAGIALALMVSEAPKRSRSFIYAADTDQAAELLDALGGFVARTPGLAGAIELGASSLTVKSSGASLSVESSDAASAWSKRPWCVIIDEFSSWPDVPNHRRLWTAIASSLPKRKDSRLILLTMAGSPVHPAAKVWKLASSSADWRASSVPGPCEWWDPADVESTRVLLTAAEFRRYVLCEWVETDEALSNEGDVLACVRPGDPVLAPRDGVRYVAALDVGTRRDLSALAVSHVENRAAGRVVVVDRVISWRPKPGLLGRVDLGDVEDTVARICLQYKAKLRFDRSQAEQLVQNLARRGVRVAEFVFSQSGANRLAKALYTSLRDRAIEIPDDPELISELQTARLVETGPGTVKLQNPAGTHDDVAVSVGMTVVDLLDRMDGLPASWGGLDMARAVVAGHEQLGDGNVSALRRDAVDPWGRSAGFAARSLLNDDTAAERWARIVAERLGGYR